MQVCDLFWNSLVTRVLTLLQVVYPSRRAICAVLPIFSFYTAARLRPARGVRLGYTIVTNLNLNTFSNTTLVGTFRVFTEYQRFPSGMGMTQS